MGSRHRSREAALKILYQADLLSEDDIGQIAGDLWKERGSPNADRAFTDELVKGVMGRREEIDAKLGAAMENWEPARLGYMERAILRIGGYELLFCSDAPDNVVIDEAIELAKSYCDPKSEGFINGVLDRMMKDKDL
ncbi:Transcription termination protein NusB [hydrothermal vent metagenome]|uniref:Transcription termination protein NusB n=1 Tax=hydrothermal vent metagenome TaxID=652676 RepID=A0A3B1CBW5_9ZZZZ